MKLPLASLLIGAVLFSAPPPATAQRTFAERDLISDVPGRADSTDSNLQNPWGLVPGPTGVFWSSNNHTGTSTLYRPDGSRVPLVVHIPEGSNTGIAVTSPADSAFVIPSGDSTARAIFIFVSEAGTITAWNNNVNLTNAVTVARTRNANYTGVALARTVAGPRLYSADFQITGGGIDVFDRYFRPVSLPAGRFEDPGLPAGYAPFNVATIGSQIFVAYALVDPATGDEMAGAGLGFVDVFDKTGHFVRRFASHGALNAPWAMVLAPAGFGDFGGALLVGNFGDGRINAFNLADGAFLGALQDTLGQPISIEGLWGLSFGRSVSGPAVANRLYFAAGIDEETHGLFGYLAPAASRVVVQCKNEARSLSFWSGQCAGTRQDDDGDDDDRRESGRTVSADSLRALLRCVSSSSLAFGSTGCFTASCDLLSKREKEAWESAARQFLALLLDRCAGVVCDSVVVSCRDRDDDLAAEADNRRGRNSRTVGEIVALLDSSLCRAQGRSSYARLEALASCAIRSAQGARDRSDEDDDRASPAAVPGESRVKLEVSALGGNPVHLASSLGARFVVSSSIPALVRFRVYDAAGRLVAEPLHDVPVTGQLVVRWDGRTVHGARVPSGTYFYRAIAGDAIASGRVVIVR